MDNEGFVGYVESRMEAMTIDALARRLAHLEASIDPDELAYRTGVFEREQRMKAMRKTMDRQEREIAEIERACAHVTRDELWQKLRDDHPEVAHDIEQIAQRFGRLTISQARLDGVVHRVKAA